MYVHVNAFSYVCVLRVWRLSVSPTLSAETAGLACLGFSNVSGPACDTFIGYSPLFQALCVCASGSVCAVLRGLSNVSAESEAGDIGTTNKAYKHQIVKSFFLLSLSFSLSLSFFFLSLSLSFSQSAALNSRECCLFSCKYFSSLTDRPRSFPVCKSILW